MASSLKLSTMKFLSSAIVLAAVGLASALDLRDPEAAAARSGETCGDPADALPFYRSYVGGSFTDHFYTARINTLNTQLKGSYNLEEVACMIFLSQEESTVPFYRVFNEVAWDNLYTANTTELDNALKAGYVTPTDGDSVTYIYPTQICGSVPFYRLFNSAIVDNFYTTSESERLQFLAEGYVDVEIAGYVLPFEVTQCD
ncbi:hypothetical protein K438DRAFT_2017237 [Mycena galopus ATCC 62051]|nr:hypothetical protein K438DRAFT_2017237 [Mycena galopus ATCC 62051]